ncbi:sensor histidine kinase [Actinacidiphila paucisporea]|uniref:histidine kinase n=1 Tax=Actinacidiphila paucisporea TaxID=310782 RepID=A0A1M7KMG6_9ACTN|nr:sensor histidine kinase [Actinacidiphila paucisporea]SHM66596.1 Signal transduction histidine kinase [Actinacidiphila paucisporea]
MTYAVPPPSGPPAQAAQAPVPGLGADPGPRGPAQAQGDRAGAVGAEAGPVARVERAARAGYARIARGLRLSPPTVDAVFAVGLFLATAAALRRPLQDDPRLLVLHAALVLPLVWRRRAPMAVFCTLSGTALVQWSFGLRIPTDVMLLIALYAVAAYSSRRRTLVAFAMLEGGVVLATLRWSVHERGAGTFVSLSAMATAAMVLGLNMRSRRDRLATLEDRAVRLERERDQQAQLAVAGERARIAREMHDIVTHNLSVMVALADGAVFAQRRSPERAATAMRQVSATGRQAITDMRRFLGVLRADEPDALRHPMPGVGQLSALVEQVRAAGLPTRLAVAGDPAAVPVAAQLTVYRLVQEALTNTLKHAPAGTTAKVEVDCTPEAVAVTVTDDGAGPAAPRDNAGSAGHGLPGMRERAAAYGGRLTAGPLPGGGWQVAAVLTLTTPEPL